MDKIKYILLVLIVAAAIGCSFMENNDLENAKIYTTIYPITYMTKELYSEYAEINSIYPFDSNPLTYTLSEKEINNYSKGNLFIYNGLSDEKNITKELLNHNNNMLIIDVSIGLTEPTNMDELWINPSNYLIIGKNIKNSLQENIKSKYLIESIDKKYADIEEKISLIDARLHSLANTASNKNRVIVIANNSFLFLQNYGFDIINLDDEDINKNNRLANIKNNFKTNRYKYILAKSSDEEKEIVYDLNGKLLTIDSFDGINEKDYINYMTDFVNQIETIVS